MCCVDLFVLMRKPGATFAKKGVNDVIRVLIDRILGKKHTSKENVSRECIYSINNVLKEPKRIQLEIIKRMF